MLFIKYDKYSLNKTINIPQQILPMLPDQIYQSLLNQYKQCSLYLSNTINIPAQILSITEDKILDIYIFDEILVVYIEQMLKEYL